MVVIDELSSFKSNKAERFKSMKRVRPMVKRIVGLTGTPAPNSLLDLWPQMYLMDMGQRLGRFIGGYRDRYFLPDKRNREIIYSYKPREGAEEAIYEQISDICISMKAVDYLDMPERIDNRIEVVMSPAERKLYDGFQKDMVLHLGDTVLDAVNAASLSGKLLQMANGAVYAEDGKVLPIHDRKLDALEDLVEAANGKPLLVAYWYKHDLQRIQARFKTARCIDTSKDIDDWNAGKITLGLIHPASAGHGLNLQDGGSTIVWFGLTWSLELYWKPNQTVLFVYDGTYWVAATLSTATTSYYGITKLSSSVTSTSTDMAATPSAVKSAYDRCSWDSITLTNALGLAYGGTGATTAAAARTNLGIAATSLYSGTLTTGSTTFSLSYKFFVIIGQPSSSAARAAIVIPASQITTTSTAYQITDESNYYSFNLYYSSTTVTLAYKARSSSGQIIRIYGIN